MPQTLTPLISPLSPARVARPTRRAPRTAPRRGGPHSGDRRSRRGTCSMPRMGRTPLDP